MGPASAAEQRWCTWPVQGEMTPNPKLLCDDRLATDGIWASGRQHPVQHRDADGSLGLLASKAAGSISDLSPGGYLSYT
jgi:hypothetical protein